MKTRKARLTFAVLTVSVAAGIVASAARQDDLTQTGPVYNLEGAWNGVVTLDTGQQIPSLDNFASNARNSGAEGSLLCTIPVSKLRHPDHPADPAFWLTMTPSGHGNWVRTGTNRYAYTVVRTLTDQDGAFFGRAPHWGTFTPVSGNELTGTMNIQFYRADTGMPYSRIITGVAHSTRVEMIYED